MGGGKFTRLGTAVLSTGETAEVRNEGIDGPSDETGRTGPRAAQHGPSVLCVSLAPDIGLGVTELPAEFGVPQNSFVGSTSRGYAVVPREIYSNGGKI